MKVKSYAGFEQQIYASEKDPKELTAAKGVEIDGVRPKGTLVIDRPVSIVGAGSVEVKDKAKRK